MINLMQLSKQNRRKYILDLTNAQLKTAVKPIIGQDYRINQIIEWVYVKKAVSFEYFTNLPKELREQLNERFFLRTLKTAKKKKKICN